MATETKILSKKVLHEGRTQTYEYELEVGSLNPHKNKARVIKREIMHCADSVVVLIFAPEIDSFVLCREFRTGVFLNHSHDDPFIFECVAGMIDRDGNPEEIARLEVWEEAGIKAGILHHIATVYASPGHMTEKTYLYCTEIEGTPKSGLFGLPEEGEEIATYILKREEVYKMMDEMKIIDSMTLSALNWFRARHG